MTALRAARVGAVLTAHLNPDARDLFLFSAAAANPHRIHYDLPWARDVEGRPGLVVHGPLQAAALGRMLTDAAGPAGRLTAFALRQSSPSYLGDVVDLRAVVTGVRVSPDGLEIDLALDAAVGDHAVARGSATVVIPAEGPDHGR